jgi:NAD(P)-dependent dehydrogenase (short-subunit alcohol dehydrogenase family)
MTELSPPLTDQVALVTGASRGIGREIARGLTAQGITTYITARQRSDAIEAARALSAETNGNVIGREFELTDADGAARLVRTIDSESGRLDILVNNAAIDIDMGIAALDTDLAAAELTFATNVIGPWRLIQAAVPIMRRNRFGRIVNVSSEIARFARMSDPTWNWPGDDAYKVSKAALNALTVLVAGWLAGSGILVNASNPGFCRTAMGAPDAPLSAAEGADVSVFLATLPDDGPHGRWFSQRQQISW